MGACAAMALVAVRALLLENNKTMRKMALWASEEQGWEVDERIVDGGGDIMRNMAQSRATSIN